MQFLRLVTVHPLLVHFTIGTLPILLVAYLMGRSRHSERWTFVGDVTLFITAAVAVVAAAFGLVSNWLLVWPGGIGTWRWLHLGFGAATALALLVMALVRLYRRRTEPLITGGFVAGAVGVVVLAVATGWVGGEMLVYRSGMAVQAAGNGALAPPSGIPARGAPKNVHDSMKRIRGSWGSIQTEVAHMLVARPTNLGFETVAREAGALKASATWLAQHKEEEEKKKEGAKEKEGQVSRGPSPAEGDLLAQAGPGTAGTTGEPSSKAQDFHATALSLAEQADLIRKAAENKDIEAVAGAAAKATALCAHCHAWHRWQ